MTECVTRNSAVLLGIILFLLHLDLDDDKDDDEREGGREGGRAAKYFRSSDFWARSLFKPRSLPAFRITDWAG